MIHPIDLIDLTAAGLETDINQSLPRMHGISGTSLSHKEFLEYINGSLMNDRVSIL